MDIGAAFGETKRAEVVSATPDIAPGNALARFRTDPAALKASALAVLDIKVAPPKTIYEANELAEKIAEAKRLMDNIEARRDGIVRPLNAEVKEVNAEAHRWSDPLGVWLKRAGTVLIAYKNKQADDARRAEDARQKALIAAAEKQQQAENSDNPALAEEASTEIMQFEAVGSAEPIRGFKTEAGTTSVRKTWKVEVIDESLVPDAYWTVDLKKLQATVDAGARSIDGCNIYEQESLTVRTR